MMFPQIEDTSLTPRELTVLQLVSIGKTDKEIAQALDMCERTVRYDLQRIRTKLAVDTRIEAVSQAFRLGLLA